MLLNKFVVVAIDKNSCNVAIVCQTHYAQVLTIESGLNNVNSKTSAYMKRNKPVDKILSNNTSFFEK